ncbi:MAG TPA: hypothetical protein VLZ06_00575 [Solirubrobacteraceae bacterium]|nr:hypothetical protein [Solirubrobacteraceae bacterium]
MTTRLPTVLAAAVLALGLAPGGAAAAAPAEDMLTYMPTEMVHSVWSGEQVEGFLSELSEYDIGQALLQMPRFKRKGTLTLPASNEQMLRVWAERAARYGEAHGEQIAVTAVFNGVLKPKGLSLELASTRGHIIAAVRSAVTLGVSGVQLDLEPYPTSPGFIELLEELDVALGQSGFAGRLSVVAPANVSRWSPAYLQRVAALVDQVDPLFYDSESTQAAAYEEWVEEGLAYYSNNVPAGTAIVPVIPCYSKNPWHDPAVEDVPNASQALQAALAAGSRVEGAGLWWWYAFYEGHLKRFDAALERAAWQQLTVNLPFSP